MTESQTQESGNTFYVIGLRVDPETEEANFYVVLMYSGDKSIPLLVDNQLAIFQRLSSVATAISKVDATKSEDDFESLEYGLDFAEALYLFQSEAIDSSATILNLMNLLSDIFDGLRVRVPSEYLLFPLTSPLMRPSVEPQAAVGRPSGGDAPSLR